MSISQAYNALRFSLAQNARKTRLGPKPSFGSPTEEDYQAADAEIDAMTLSELLRALERHEE